MRTVLKWEFSIILHVSIRRFFPVGAAHRCRSLPGSPAAHQRAHGNASVPPEGYGPTWRTDRKLRFSSWCPGTSGASGASGVGSRSRLKSGPIWQWRRKTTCLTRAQLQGDDHRKTGFCHHVCITGLSILLLPALILRTMGSSTGYRYF